MCTVYKGDTPGIYCIQGGHTWYILHTEGVTPGIYCIQGGRTWYILHTGGSHLVYTAYRGVTHGIYCIQGSHI